jgi:hypothetical protein
MISVLHTKRPPRRRRSASVGRQVAVLLCIMF